MEYGRFKMASWEVNGETWEIPSRTYASGIDRPVGASTH